jgi:hypothetical protein
VGIAKHVGHRMTFKVFTDITQRLYVILIYVLHLVQLCQTSDWIQSTGSLSGNMSNFATIHTANPLTNCQ